MILLQLLRSNNIKKNTVQQLFSQVPKHIRMMLLVGDIRDECIPVLEFLECLTVVEKLPNHTLDFKPTVCTWRLTNSLPLLNDFFATGKRKRNGCNTNWGFPPLHFWKWTHLSPSPPAKTSSVPKERENMNLEMLNIRNSFINMSRHDIKDQNRGI